MGRIYRIKHSKTQDFLAHEYRNRLGLQYSVTLIVTLGITLSGFSQTGSVALGLLLTPMLIFGVLSNFQTKWPRLTTPLLALISGAGFLIAASLLIYSIIWLAIAEPNECLFENCANFAWPYAKQLRHSLSDSLLEFAPLAATAGVFLSALRAQIHQVEHIWGRAG